MATVTNVAITLAPLGTFKKGSPQYVGAATATVDGVAGVEVWRERGGLIGGETSGHSGLRGSARYALTVRLGVREADVSAAFAAARKAANV